MTQVFIDTSFLLALLSSDDAHHRSAIAWQGTIRSKFLTTEYIIVEFVDALATEAWRPVAVATVAEMRKDPLIQIVPAGAALLDEGLKLFSQRPDKRWGLTDCISFVTMQREKINQALTVDHHFEQAGFVALLRQPPPKT